ncbi:MMS19 nucleotide excision repair protein homolog [Nematostella vectensis]|uniref:MMS19 nucleotide excision repair protein homolog n=1 Tax=Nematostella vectensis TaxID=45351 RepID=UPI002077503F|nr:MMS19 nucleotide excision repair protein homolog [Nematostella vectensis]
MAAYYFFFPLDKTYKEITSTAVPLILSKYNDEATQGLVKKLLLDVLLGLLTASKPYYKRKGSVLASHTSALVDVLFSALVSDSPGLCRAAIAGLVSMVTLPGLLPEQKVGMFVEHLTSFVLNTKDLTVRQESNAALAFLAIEFPELIKTKLVSVLAEQLQKEDGSAMDEENISHLQSDKSHPQYDQMLNTLSAVCTEEGVVRHVVPIILDHGEYLVTGKDLERGVLHGKISETLKCLNSIVKGTLQSSTVEPNYYTEVVIYRIIDLCTQSALQESPDCPMATPEALALVCSIVRQVISHLAVNEAEDVLHIIVSNFIEGKTPLSARAEQKFAPLEPSSPWQQSQLVTVLMAAVCSARREVRIPRQKELVPRLQVLASGCNHRKTTVAASKCLGGIINKMAQGDDLTADLHSLKGQLQNHMDGNEEQRWRAVITWLWLTRALVTRSHPMAQEFVQKVLHLLDDVSVGRVAADGFYVIVSDCDDVMNQAMHADIKMMYKQRFFMETLPLLLKGFHDTRPECKYLYLCALSHLLQWIPKQVLLTEIPTLMPMLIQALSRDEPSLLLSTLQTLYSLVFDAPEVISRQVTSLIPNFLELAKCKASMKVRMEAIKCLGAMTTLEHHVVYVYKARVIKELACTLDDPKRLVRAEAVKCRNEWYLLGSSAR